MSIGLEKSDFLIYPGSEVGTISIIKMNTDYCDNIKAHHIGPVLCGHIVNGIFIKSL